jgi:hypothetical protein
MPSNTRGSSLGKIIILLIVVVGVFFIVRYMHRGGANSGSTQPSTAAVTCAQATAYSQNPSLPTSLDASCAQLPYAPAVFTSKEGGTLANQQTADVYSWLTFVALNWPHQKGGCAADTGSSITKDPSNPTWQTWIHSDQVFKTKGAPDDWCGGSGMLQGDQAALQKRVSSLPAKVQKLAMAHPEVGLYLVHTAKSEELTESTKLLGATAMPDRMKQILQSTDLPIVDQNGRYARFQISMNEDEYNFIKSNMLYTVSGQQKFGNVTFPGSNAQQQQMGVMELKAAWKILGANDDPSHFFTQWAIVYNDNTGEPSPGPNPVQVGLVGLHILHKAQYQASWAWSTFEQVDNTTKNFFNQNCQAPNPNPDNHCVVDQPTAQKDAPELDANGKPLQFPTQIQQKPYIQRTNTAYSTHFQGLLAGTPWQYYELVSTQWSSGSTGAQPQFLGAPSQETFVPQYVTVHGSQQILDGCIACHTGAVDQANNTSEVSFMLNNAVQQ